jgi:hypothetical protein
LLVQCAGDDYCGTTYAFLGNFLRDATGEYLISNLTEFDTFSENDCSVGEPMFNNAVPDVNGDNISEILISNPEQGKVYIVFGKKKSNNNLELTLNHDLNGTLGFEFFTKDSNEKCGTSIAGGLFDGDSFGDVLIGCPNDAGTGRVLIWHGNTNCLSFSLFDFSFFNFFLFQMICLAVQQKENNHGNVFLVFQDLDSIIY